MADFWSRFAAEHWERRHLTVDDMFPGAPISPEALFPLVVAACDPARARPAGVSLRFFLGGQPHHGADHLVPPEFRPRLEDASLEGYRDRLRAQTGKTFGLVISNLQALDFGVFELVRTFTRPLFERVGMPNGGAALELYFGEQAPFPLHLDPDSVFHMPVLGRKRIRAWTADAVAAEPRLKGAFPAAYEPYLATSILLETAPGGVLYWPSSYWHTGENRGQLSASLALSFTVFEDDDRAMMHLLQVTAEKDTRRDDDNSLGDFLAAGGADALRRMYLKLETGAAYVLCPAAGPTPRLADDDALTGDPTFPIRHVAAADDAVDVAANGHLETVPAALELEPLLARLNAGEPARVADLLGARAGETRDRTRQLLAWLASVRAVRVTSSGRS